MSRRPFIYFKNRYLVESGTYLGEGVEEALANGFEHIITYEVYAPTFMKAYEKFRNHSNVTVLFKSSIDMFDEIKNINEPITFWLDGHYSSGNTSYDITQFYPLLKELDSISKHHIKNHSICIDDRRLMNKTDENTPNNIGVTEDEVRKALLKINSNYKIEYRDGHIKDDVIVAFIE